MHSPENCDVNPVSLSWSRSFAKGELVKICGECRGKIERHGNRFILSERLMGAIDHSNVNSEMGEFFIRSRAHKHVPDPVAHPPHYNAGKIEVIEFIEDQDLNFARGNAIKYIARAGKKLPKGCDGRYTPEGLAAELEDLKKARWYVTREIEIVAALLEKRTVVRPNDMKGEA